jgi:hypothetical protein
MVTCMESVVTTIEFMSLSCKTIKRKPWREPAFRFLPLSFGLRPNPI